MYIINECKAWLLVQSVQLGMHRNCYSRCSKGSSTLSAPDLGRDCYYLHVYLIVLATLPSNLIPYSFTFLSLASSQIVKQHVMSIIQNILTVFTGISCIDYCICKKNCLINANACRFTKFTLINFCKNYQIPPLPSMMD